MLKIRKAEIKDSRAIHSLRNNENILSFFFNQEKNSFEEHHEWFKKALTSHQRLLIVVEEHEELVGVVRFDQRPDPEEVEASIYVSDKHWGKGIGLFGLVEGEQILKETFPRCTRLRARILTSNNASLRLFEKANYKPIFTELEKRI